MIPLTLTFPSAPFFHGHAVKFVALLRCLKVENTSERGKQPIALSVSRMDSVAFCMRVACFLLQYSIVSVDFFSCVSAF